MQHVKMLADVVDVARRAADRWYVTNGATSVGPVKLDLLARGVEAGKVPLESFIRHEGWKVWRPLWELAEVTSDDGVAEAPRASRGAVGGPADLMAAEVTNGSDAWRVSAPGDFIPHTTEAGEIDGRDALLLLLSAAVARCHADAAIIHHVDGEGATAVCAHGPDMFEALGLRTALSDPAMLAAAAGAVVIAEPVPGASGRAMLARLARLGVPLQAAAMLPICPHRRLFGTIELGRRRPFQTSEIAGVEAMVDSLVTRLESLR